MPHTAGGCRAGAVSVAGQEDELSRRKRGSEPEKRSSRHPGGIQNLFFDRIAAVPLPVVELAPNLLFQLATSADNKSSTLATLPAG